MKLISLLDSCKWKDMLGVAASLFVVGLVAFSRTGDLQLTFAAILVVVTWIVTAIVLSEGLLDLSRWQVPRAMWFGYLAFDLLCYIMLYLLTDKLEKLLLPLLLGSILALCLFVYIRFFSRKL